MQARGSGSAGQGDNQERFLADLRALRDAAALGYDELAARAHYPSNILKEAEHGPSLPGLPILAAYVRACEADVPEWEERWRRLAHEAPSDPGLPVRAAGASPAAVAGARAGITIAPPDVYDPERIRAALRGQGGSADHAARGVGHSPTVTPGRAEPATAHPGPGTPDAPSARGSRAAGWGDTAGSPASTVSGGSIWDTGPGREARSGWDAGTRWDTPPSWSTAVGQDTVPANGNHHATQLGSVFDPPVAETTGAGASTATVEETRPASWRPSGDVAAPGVDRPWPERAETEPARWSQGDQIAPSVTADAKTEPTSPPADAGYAAPDPADSGSAWPPADAKYAAPDLADAESAWPPADAGYTAPDLADSGPDWPPADSGYAPGRDGGPGPTSDQDAGSAARVGVTGAVLAQATTQSVAAPAIEPRRDRFFPLRLIMVMVVAAIVGSVLVLLIR